MAEIVQQPPSAPKKLRLFIAINLPEALKAAIGEFQSEVEAGISDNAVRWTGTAQLHITLKFLGSVPEADLGEIQASLRSACVGHCAFDLEAVGLGGFPNVRSPRVLWGGLRGDIPKLAPLQQQIDAALSRWAEPEKREFTPHLTLGRVRGARRKDLDTIAKRFTGRDSSCFGQWHVDKIDLMQSVLSSHGPTYICLTSVPLI